jgi:signal transduction histidine kinase
LFAALSVGYVFPLEANGHAYILFHFLCQAAAIVVTTAIMSTYDGAWRVAEAQSNAARDEVLAANDAKSTFLAHMSHELRTPLNAVLGYVELIQEDARDDQMADLARVRDAGGHLLALVDEVLDLARIEAGHIEMQPERLELHELMQSAIDEVHPLTQQHHTTCTLEGASVAAMGDRVRVRQVALNLLSNAAKFTVEGSIEVSVERRGRLVEVAVTDTGPGMTAEEVLRCFEPFEQGEAGRGQGTGLGLVISRRLCEAMGGQLTATSEVGVGTVFRMTLPYCP